MKKIFVLVIFVVGLGLNIVAQSVRCSVGSVVFKCSPAWSQIRSGIGDKPFVAYHLKSRVALFLEPIPLRNQDDPVYEKALIDIFDEGLSIDKRTIKIKPSEDYWDESKYSSFENFKGGKAVYDPPSKTFYHVHYCVFTYEKKTYIAGFASPWATGDLADATFNDWKGGGGSGDSELRELIFSVTKENADSDLPGGPPPARLPLPGGPPPAAPRPKTK